MNVDTEHEPRITHARIEATAVHALAALFDDGLPAPASGEPLPPLWHWVALPRWFSASETGPDGHQRLGLQLPDVGRSRRMFAGGHLEFLADVLVDEEVRREDTVRPPVPKSGRQGDFVLVQVETAIYNSGGQLAIRERQDLIYRDATTGPGGPAPERPSPLTVVPTLLHRDSDGWTFATDPTKLLRFSSATSNGHRIHYDHPYATQVEGYPGLVVHGPLMTLALAEILRLEPGNSPAGTFTHRALRPLFCGQPARIIIEPAGADPAELTLITPQGAHSSLRVGR